MIPTNSFVAMFDILGFKALREKMGTQHLYDLYVQSLAPQIQHAAALKSTTVKENGKSLYLPVFGPHSIEYLIVSDSIILFANGDTFPHFLKVISASYNLLCSGFCGHKAPIRGAIGYGDLIVDKNNYWIGSSIEDAYAGEQSQVWSGCALTRNCEEFIKKHRYLEQLTESLIDMVNQEGDKQRIKYIEEARRQIVQCDIPEQYILKDRTREYKQRTGYALDWTLKVYEGAGEKAFTNTRDDHALKIIENTKIFEEWARKRRYV